MNKTGTMNVGSLLKIAAIRYREKEAIFCSSTGRRFTFIELNQRTNRLANALIGLGIQKNDVVGFLSTNRSEIVETYFALAKIGAVGIPLNYRFGESEIVELMSHCEAKAFIFDPQFDEMATKIRSKLPLVKHYIAIGDDSPDFALKYSKLQADNATTEPNVDVYEDDKQYFNLTSGTTGHPKVYVLTHYNNATAIMSMSSLYNVTRKDVIFTAFPMFGRVGFAWTGLGIFTGALNVIHNFNPEEALALMESEKVTITNWVPTMASFALMSKDIEKYDLSSLRAFVFAGSPLPSSVRKETEKKICPYINEYYGLQESGLLVNIDHKQKELRPDSVGQPAFMVDVRIVDEKGTDLPQGETGAIIARAPACTEGYFQNEEKNKESFKNGWFYTGDLGYFDEENFLFLRGRTKDMIITGGQNVFSIEIEDIIIKHPDVSECAVIGLPHDIWGEAVTAVVVKNPDAKVTKDELISYVKDQVAGFKTPKKIVWSDEILPRTATGKVTKFILEDKYANEKW